MKSAYYFVLLTTVFSLFSMNEQSINSECEILEQELLIVAQKGDLDKVKSCINQRINCNTKNIYGKTAFMLAAQHGHTAIVQLLLEYNSEMVNLQCNMGFTALMLASCKGHAEVVKVLLKVPTIDLFAVDNIYKRNALKWTLERNYVEIEKLLTQAYLEQWVFNARDNNDIDSFVKYLDVLRLDMTDSQGNTVLHRAAKVGNTHIIKLLLSKCSHLADIVNSKNETAKNIALLHNQREAYQMLLAQEKNKKFKEFIEKKETKSPTPTSSSYCIIL